MKPKAKFKRLKTALFGGLFGTLASVAAIVTVVACGTSVSPLSTVAAARELQQFIEDYPGTVDRSSGSAVIKDGAFMNRNDLPEGFTLPALIAGIGANAFKGARLPRGFTIPPNAAAISASAFAEAVLGDDYLWDRSAPVQGAKVDLIENNLEYRDFTTQYPDTLEKRAVKAGAFRNNPLLGDGFALPSFITRINASAFADTVLPADFRFPAALRSIGTGAFLHTRLPAGIALPAGLKSIGWVAADVQTGEVPFLGTIFPARFKIPATVTDIAEDAFQDAVAPLGFAIPASARIWKYRTDASPAGFRWETASNTALLGVVLPANAAWDRGSPVAGATVVSTAG